MILSRRDFVKTAGKGAAALSLSGIVGSCFSDAKPPNILFIMSDDHAEQAISCYGSTLIKTPNIDRIANAGIRFTNSFVTNSICAPSRATMLTGKYSHKNGLRDNRDEFDGTQVTFPKLLQKAGYQTGIVGKWHLKSEPTGFDDWQILIRQGEYYNPRFNENGVVSNYEGYTTDLITDKAISALENRDQEKPFCMLVHHKAPHRNWMPHTKYLGAFDDQQLPIPDSIVDNYNNRKAAAEADMRIADMFLSFDLKLQKGFYKKETGTGGKSDFALQAEENWHNTYNRLTEQQKAEWDNYYDKINQQFKAANLKERELLNWKYQRYIKDYLSCILSVDEGVGRLLDWLDENHLTEDTIVIYTSDQGFYLGEHGWYDKRFMYEESLGMPLVMCYPKEIAARQVSDKMVMNLDFAQTFLDYAGSEEPPDMQGASFRKIVSAEAGEWREAIYYHYYEYPHGWHNVRPHYGIRTKRFKLIHFYGDTDEWELYDLLEDPNEMKNVFGLNRVYDEVVFQLQQDLENLQRKYGDSLALSKLQLK